VPLDLDGFWCDVRACVPVMHREAGFRRLSR